MANGRRFSDDGFTCASWDYVLGTRLLVSNISGTREVVVVVTDRTNRRFKGKRIDLSKAAFQKLDDLNKGLIRVNVKEIK